MAENNGRRAWKSQLGQAEGLRGPESGLQHAGLGG